MNKKLKIGLVIYVLCALAIYAIAQSIQANGGPASGINGTMVEGSDYAGTPLAHFVAVDTTGHLILSTAATGGTGAILSVRTDAGNPFSCILTMTTNTTTLCQAPTAGQRTFVQSYQIFTQTAGTATTVSLEYGTGVCSSPTVISPLYPTTTAVPANSVGDLAEFNGSGLIVPSGSAICAVQAGTTAGTVIVTVTGFVAP